MTVRLYYRLAFVIYITQDLFCFRNLTLQVVLHNGNIFYHVADSDGPCCLHCHSARLSDTDNCTLLSYTAYKTVRHCARTHTRHGTTDFLISYTLHHARMQGPITHAQANLVKCGRYPTADTAASKLWLRDPN